MRCQGTNREGEACGSPAVGPDGWCPAHRPLVCVVGANGVGKDWLLARLALWWAYAKGGLVLITAPTERQAREVLFGEIRRAWHRAGEDELPGELFTSNLRLGPDRSGGIIGMTSTAASRLTGFHGERVLGVLSEAPALEHPNVVEGTTLV